MKLLCCWALPLLRILSTTAFQTPSPAQQQRQLQMVDSSDGQTAAAVSPKKFRLVEGIKDIVDDYDIFLLDMWGVMHDGITPYDGVLDVIQQLQSKGKDMIILSNSSKRKSKSIKSLTKLGFSPTADFTEIITSGEVAYHLLSQTSPQQSSLAPQPWNALTLPPNASAFCFGSGDGDREYIESCGLRLATSMATADLIVARGTFTIVDDATVIHKTDDVYAQRMAEALAMAAPRRLPMIVANPDKVRPDADRSPMPGTIGDAYAAALLQHDDGIDAAALIKRIGKPFSDVYEIGLRGKDRARACMVGDALETDVAGGSGEGIDTIWVVGNGVHSFEVEAAGDGSFEKGCDVIIDAFNQRSDETYAKGRQLMPTVVMPFFKW